MSTPATRIEMTRLSDLRPASRNPKLHDNAAIVRSIETFGFTVPVTIDERTGRMVAGHGRLDALLAMQGDGKEPPGRIEVDQDGAWLVPVLRGISFASDAEAEAYIIADNKLTMAGGWDEATLAKMMEDTRAASSALAAATGYSSSEVSRMLERARMAAARNTPDPGCAPIEKVAVTQAGEVFELGVHRLVCGDSTLPSTWVLLMNETPQGVCVWTDPPYGISYVGGYSHTYSPQQRRAMGGGEVENDGLDPDALCALIVAALEGCRWACVSGASIYMASPAGPMQMTFMKALCEAATFLQGMAWVKDTLVLGRSKYHYRHETVLFGSFGSPVAVWLGDRKQTTVFEVPKPHTSKDHPTMKPIALIEPMILNSSDAGQVVIDPFAGSGSVLIAAARQGRVARLIECNPLYCDAIRRRWTKWATEAGIDPGPGALAPAIIS